MLQYVACQGLYQPALASVGAFDNAPLPGCQVVLINQSGTGTVLCAGRGVVPVEFRRHPRVRIQPGASQPCGSGPM